MFKTNAHGLVAKLPDTTMDVSPWNHWKMPAIVEDVQPEFDAGPVLVTVEYRLNRVRTDEFLEAIHEYGRARRRDGAIRWRLNKAAGAADATREPRSASRVACGSQGGSCDPSQTGDAGGTPAA